jgi:hypothetical protein
MTFLRGTPRILEETGCRRVVTEGLTMSSLSLVSREIPPN